MLVANGDALDVSCGTAQVLQSERGLVAPFNRGIEWLREHANPRDWVCWFDDDDLYCANYLEEIAAASRDGATACSRPVVWMRSPECELWQSGGPGRHHGPTLASRLDVTVPIPEKGRSFGEDGDWVLAMQARGIEFATLPVNGFCWMRGDRRHACPLDTNAFRMLGAIERHYGTFDERVVSGEIERAPELVAPLAVDHDHVRSLLNFAACEAAINQRGLLWLTNQLS